jgi:secreted PhoX family phosphatase
MSISRRQLLSGASLAGVGLVAGPTVSSAATWSSATAASTEPGCEPGPLFRPFGPLLSKAGDLIALPEDFSYQEVATSGQTDIHDGTGTLIGKTPERPDGTMTVREGGRAWRLIQNHEGSVGSPLPVPHVAGTVYDPGALAGGATIIETTTAGARVSEWVGLSGTISNCAGGPTPWGSWLSCEETEDKAGTGTLEKDHGYVFEVFAGLPEDQVPEPIKAWGRFQHEGVVVEPSRRRVYLTEDSPPNPNGLFYRWTAPDGVKLRPRIAEQLGPDDGTLEAMAVHQPDGSILTDLAYLTSAQIGRPFTTSWVPVPDRQASTTPVRLQFAAAGEVTRSRKLEGAWGTQWGAYFVASFANAKADLPVDATMHDGQLWYYSYRDETLTLVGYCPFNALVHGPLAAGWEARIEKSIDLAFDGLDGCHVSPYGPLILTEDGDTANHVLSWSREVGFQAIARNLVVLRTNAAGAHVYSEMTGPTFSPDGNVLFCNVFNPGHGLAISGPWSQYLR